MRLSALVPGWRGPGDPEISGLSCDSRSVSRGDLFAALAGVKQNGAAFIASAVEKGAAAVLAAQGVSAPVPLVIDENPRRALALIAARFFGRQPETVAAVTGTNGKTSVAAFVRQIFEHCGRAAASMGTVGIVSPKGEQALAHTTPDPIVIHAALARLAEEGVTHLALEASSHGLDQHRLDGVRIKAAAFTNLTRDHLDYHPSFEAYRDAKLRLFRDVVSPDGAAVIDADGEGAAAFLEASKARGLRLLTTGAAGETIRLARREAFLDGQRLVLVHEGREFDVRLKLAGGFQASNVLVAAGLALALGESPDAVFAALPHLTGARGRLERVAAAKSGAPVFVDYAHTPDALQTVLKALRPHVQGRLHVVFGCGGDRDPGKRKMMGAAAAALADHVIVTDDNPRSEVPAAIRKAILEGAPGAQEIGDRAEAIAAGIKGLAGGDILVIAGKGHETGQIIGGVTLPFDDKEVARAAARAQGGTA